MRRHTTRKANLPSLVHADLLSSLHDRWNNTANLSLGSPQGKFTNHKFNNPLLRKSTLTLPSCKYHDNPRTAAEYIQNVPEEYINDQFLQNLRNVIDLHAAEYELIEAVVNSTIAADFNKTRQHQIHYTEQEFQSMDWECSKVDPRWNHTLSIIMLRNPIERHLSEFFYSGPGQIRLNVKKLHVNKKYTQEVRELLLTELPDWLNGPKNEKKILGRWYTDNFHIRALAGCSRGDDCFQYKNITTEEFKMIAQRRSKYLNATAGHVLPNPNPCTLYFNSKIRKIDPCSTYGREQQTAKEMNKICPVCDSPCGHPVAAWGPITHSDLSRAISALNSYDVVLITETLDNDDQAAFLADVLGVQSNATFSLKYENTRAKKITERDKTHLYRDLLLNLTSRELSERIHEENKLEIELFEYAVERNRKMVDQWKKESGWDG